MSTLPTAKPNHRKLPRKRRAPSGRDQAILVAYRVHGRTQQELADEYHLSQRRISAIVCRVERWRAELLPAVDEELDSRERQRLERWLERERLQAIHSRAMRAYDTQQPALVSVREGQRDGKPFKEETRREQGPNVQLLKVALRAAVDLGKLNDKPEPPTEEPKSIRSRWWHIHRQLCELRREFRAASDPAEDAIDDDEIDDNDDHALVHEWMNALVGKAEAAGCVQSASADADTRSSDGWHWPLASEEPASDSRQPETMPTGVLDSGNPTSRVVPNSDLDPEGQAASPADTATLLGPSALAGCQCHPASGAFRSTQAPYEAASNCSTCSNATAATARETPSIEPAVSAPTASSEPTSDRRHSTTDPSSLSPQKNKPAIEQQPASPAERRRLHQEKLEQLREAQRLGLPIQFVFDPEDGPIPRPTYQLDGVGY